MTRIEVKNITKVYDSGGANAPAVDDVSIDIEPGELFFLLGPSGCGKTTLLRIIAGLVEPSGGAILFNGKDVTWTSVESRNTAMVFQNYALWPHMTVWQNVQFGPMMRGTSKNHRVARVRENLERVEMADFAKRKPNQLSGGQQQRIALARALAASPACLLLDEPLSNLDARLRLHMRSQLRKMIKDSGATAIYVTHDQKEALSMADRLAVMNDGRIVQTGPPEDVYHKPISRFVADFLGEANFIHGKIGAATGPTGHCIVVTPAGQILCPPAPDSALSITCCVRPERITILDEHDERILDYSSRLDATIEADVFLGEMRQYTCLLDGGSRWKVTTLAATTRELQNTSRRVKLCFMKQDVSLLS